MASAYQTPSGAPYFATTSNIAAEPHPFPPQVKPAQQLQAPSTQAKSGVEQETHKTPGTPKPGEYDEIMQYDETLRAAEMSPGGHGQPESQDTFFESAPHESRNDTMMETAEASPSSDPEIPEPRHGRPDEVPAVPALSKPVAEQIDQDGTPGKEEQKEQVEQVAVVANDANVLHASAETKEVLGGHAAAEAAPKRNGKRPKAAAKKSAAMPRKKQGTQGTQGMAGVQGPLGVQGQEQKGVQGPFQPEQSSLSTMKSHRVTGSPNKEAGNEAGLSTVLERHSCLLTSRQEAPDARDAQGSEGDWEVGDGELQLGLRAALGREWEE